VSADPPASARPVVLSPPARTPVGVVVLLPLLHRHHPSWSCAPVQGTADQWLLSAADAVLHIDVATDPFVVTVTLGQRLLQRARTVLAEAGELERWLAAAIRAQARERALPGTGPGSPERPVLVDRDDVWQRLGRGERLTAGMRGRVFFDFFLQDGALMTREFHEGFDETRPGSEEHLFVELADDPRDLLTRALSSSSSSS